MVREHIIENWEFKDQPEHLRKIRDVLLQHKDVENLLQLYRQVLRSGNVVADDNPKQLLLLKLGLVVNHQGKLEGGNRIYETIFSRSWVDNELGKIKFQKKLRQSMIGVTFVIVAAFGTYTGINVVSRARNCPVHEVLFGTCVATLAQVKNVPSGTFSYGGSTSFAPLRSRYVIDAITHAHPLFILQYTPPLKGENPGSETGIQMLIRGELSFAQSSRSLKSEQREIAKEKGFALEEKTVAIDNIAIYVNLGLAIQGLTKQQVQQIFAGEITNWQQVGGPNLKINVFSRDLKASGTVDLFKEVVLAGKPFGPFEEVKTTTKSLNKVAANLGGIGYATASEVVSQKTVKVKPLPIAESLGKPYVPPFSGTNINKVNQLALADGSYPFTRKLYVIIKKDGGRDEQAGTAYANLLLSVEGQKLVEKADFAPIHAFRKQ